MDNNYGLLISKINEFTQKFYLNKLLRGIIYALALLLSVYLLLFLLVYYFHPGTVIKTILFFSFLFLFVISVSAGIIKPALSYFRLTKTLSTGESAAMIGNHFQEVRDKLINTLQLKELADLSPQHNQLILAGIEQKINELKPIPFSSAIRLEENKKYIKYFLIPLLLIFIIGMVAPAILREGTSSFVQYDKEILAPAPFNFNIRNRSLTVLQGDDLKLDLSLDGDKIPQEVYLQEGVNTFKLEKKNNTNFHYTFKNIQKNKVFSFSAGGFTSARYQVTVKPRPEMLSLRADLSYPAYLNKKNERIENAGDLLVPQGTVIKWLMNTANSEHLNFRLDQQITRLPVREDLATFTARILKNTSYRITPVNRFSAITDSLQHRIEVIVDLSPEISVVENPDSLSSKAVYFSGQLHDDHGFSALRFICRVRSGNRIKRNSTTAIPVKKNIQAFSFFHFLNLKNIPLEQGDTLEYFFEVADNDGVNGPKLSRTAIKTYEPPSEQQIAKQLKTSSNALKKQMDAAIQLATGVEKESKKLGQQLKDKKDLSFEDKKEIAQLLDKQKKLESALKDIQQQKEKNTLQQEDNEALKADLAEKQKQIDNLFNHVLHPETKALLEKLQELMEQNNKEKMQQELSKMNMDNKSLKNELDRILELYKQLEFEQQLNRNIDRLKSLAKKQQELAVQAKNKPDSPLDQIKKSQQQISSDFKEIKKELQQLEEKNQLLERPNSFQSPDKESQQIQEQQESIQQQLEKNQPQKAAPLQDEATKQLQDLSRKLEESQQESTEMESNLNAEELRMLLQHLLYNSFEQEKLMLKLKKMPNNDPSYVGSVQQQRGIKDNMKTIADSLSSLSKRIPQIESTVNEEMQKINFNIDKSLEHLGERHTAEGLKNQQYTMTSINNLSLMLNEVLDQLEKNKKNGKGGGKSGKKTMQQLQQMQEKLNKNMQQAKDQLQKEGNKGNVPKGKFSEEFAKMAQQQQMIREALQKINTEEHKDGKGAGGNLNQLISDMKITESELVNKKLEQATLNRQKNLLRNLLEADKAEREKDEDAKRESNAGKEFPPSYKKMQEQFLKKQAGETEQLQKLPLELNYYYKNKISDYFKLLNLQ
ncbi:DUF4175 family protein [Pedobacter sp. AW31-3R]|uniref:DUF4175 family protein n=1 Tax=Pedobacter sp. AW31-3R TaxID=3445781 RepID=UPI003F9F9B15